MSLFKLLPIAAVGAAGVVGTQALKKSADTVTKVGAAATYEIEMAGIADAVAMEYTENERLPLDNFSDFLRQNMREARGGNKRDRAKDPWGTDYKLAQAPNGFEVRSAGPDTEWGTKDDLTRFYELTGIGPAPAQQGASARSAAAQAHTRRVTEQAQQRPPSQSKEETERKVIEFQKKRAAAGSPSFQYELALRFLEGKGLEKDLEQAKYWLQKSAEGGSALAQNKLAELGWGRP